MTYNVYNEAVALSIDYVVNTIEIANADIVGLQEAETYHIIAIAKQLGWYYNTIASVISRWPIETYTTHRKKNDTSSVLWVRVSIPDCKPFLVTSIHLPSQKYGPQQLHNNVSPSQIIKDELSLRVEPLSIYLDMVHNSTEPLIIVGDNNSPSHLDDNTVKWPVSKLFEQRGFIDAYRTIRSNVIKDLGYTWWAKRDAVKCTETVPCVRKEPSARIDYIYTKRVTVIDAMIVGDDKSDLVIHPWLSDHRAVVVTLLV